MMMIDDDDDDWKVKLCGSAKKREVIGDCLNIRIIDPQSNFLCKEGRIRRKKDKKIDDLRWNLKQTTTLSFELNFKDIFIADLTF